MDKIRTLIVDDERPARQRLRRLVEAELDLAVAGECASGFEALEFLQDHGVDLLFLDVQMPGMDGFSMLEALGEIPAPATVFVTAYDEFAVRAFEVHALDYLLKPYDQARFRKTLERARAHLRGPRNPSAQEQLLAALSGLRPRKRHVDRFAVKSNGRIVFVRCDDIDWIEAADNYVCLHVGQTTHLVRDTMNAVEARLDGEKFLRIHRSTILNVERIRELQPWFRGDHLVILTTGQKLTLSRNYRDALRRLLGEDA